MHGLSNPGTDDRDEMGVCVEPPEYLLGFQRFEHFVYRTQPEGVSYQGIELLTTGRITLPMVDPERAALREVRSGAVELDAVLEHLDRVTTQLADACEAPELPDYSDVAAVDRFVVRAYRRMWDEGLGAS